MPILATDGNFSTPMVIFNGAQMGYIVQKELPQLDPTSIYACQGAAWMDEHCMLIWVDQIIGPYLVINPSPHGVQLVIHVDPPAEHKAYLHRSGRTGRAAPGR